MLGIALLWQPQHCECPPPPCPQNYLVLNPLWGCVWVAMKRMSRKIGGEHDLAFFCMVNMVTRSHDLLWDSEGGGVLGEPCGRWAREYKSAAGPCQLVRRVWWINQQHIPGCQQKKEVRRTQTKEMIAWIEIHTWFKIFFKVEERVDWLF